MKQPLRNLLLVPLATLVACAGPPPCRPLEDEPGRTPATTCVVASAAASPLERALRDYDAQGLAALLEDGDPRVAALAAHGLGEILRLEASVAEGQGDVARLEALTARRIEVARHGLAAVETALVSSPADADLMVARGELRAYLIDGFRAGLLYGRAARRELEAALAPHPLDPDARLAWAKQYYYLPATAGGDLDHARRDLEAIVADTPDHEPTWGFLGQVYLALGREAEARAALERALCLNPRSLRGRAWLRPRMAGGSGLGLTRRGSHAVVRPSSGSASPSSASPGG